MINLWLFVAWLRIAKKNPIIIKPQIDNRYLEDNIVSYDGRQLKALSIPNNPEAESYIKKSIQESNSQVIGFDEAQFYELWVIDLIGELRKDKRVIVAGLSEDFRGIPFKTIAYLAMLADHVVKKDAMCMRCHANLNLLINSSVFPENIGPQITSKYPFPLYSLIKFNFL